MTRRTERLLWWVGIPCLVALLTWGPYIALNVWHHSSWAWWRVPFVPIVLFDTSAYLEWIGTALAGLSAGSHIGPFAWIVSVLGRLLPDSWSVAEIWILTLWASVTAGVWLLARVFAAWGGLSTSRSRMFSVILWCSVILPFMPRPGVFTWYVPFYAAALIGVWSAQRALSRSAYPAAAAWSAAALALAWVYPYFVVHCFIWLAAIWIIHLHGRFPRVVRLVGIAGILGAVPAFALITPWLLQPSFRLTFELQERAGLAFSRLPVVSNSLILALAWTGFVVLAARGFAGRKEATDRLYGLAVGWIALLFAWFSNVFTGVYIHNDHFRTPALILSWMSLAAVWKIVSDERGADGCGVPRAQKPPRTAAAAFALFFAVSAAMVLLYVVKKSYVFSGDDLNVIHASHWLTLAAASAILWRGADRTRLMRPVCAGLFAFVVIALGVSARTYVFVKEAVAFPSYVPYVRTIEWIRANVPATSGVCADPRKSDILGSFTGRIAYPSFASIMLPKSDEDIMDDVKTELGPYDAVKAGTAETYIRAIDSFRGTTCAQFAIWSRLLSMAGWSQEDIDRVTGCPRARMLADEERVREALGSRMADDAQFRAMCPAVVITRDDRAFWTLPADYRETKIDGVFSVWSPASSERTSGSRLLMILAGTPPTIE